MKIDLDWLNRIGIILNFFAGFLLAPDLIGRQKLLNYEELIEEKLTNYIEYMKKNMKENIFTYPFNLITKIKLLKFNIDSHIDPSSTITDRILIYTIGSIVSIFIIFNVLFNILMSKFITLLLKILDAFENFLKTEETLINILTIIGIIFFIVGNAFQLIASFKK
ncbi:hypothetical protein NIES4075_72850 [Tolypothrix sp. NIES-4075]|uniref:hypothetical protein n=1 Tax=Tolypothrix sp. NIES-4075 TaxID=2005459 RepID=UPI000B5CE60C|nr:hypothetical protein [Tolypothrix sp. NIES-4075]GAX46264.1 hypothetical protein NIES4075_72850 [Tolypothrix sp. NIES-4075]